MHVQTSPVHAGNISGCFVVVVNLLAIEFLAHSLNALFAGDEMYSVAIGSRFHGVGRDTNSAKLNEWCLFACFALSFVCVNYSIRIVVAWQSSSLATRCNKIHNDCFQCRKFSCEHKQKQCSEWLESRMAWPRHAIEAMATEQKSASRAQTLRKSSGSPSE